MEKVASQNSELKEKIASQFGSAAPYYDEHAELQKEVSNRLIASLEPWKSMLPSGPIIELGCGTGFVTEGLAKLYPNRKIEVTDLSPQMVEFSKNKFAGNENIEFHVQDAEEIPYNDPHYAMTISGFSAQWFTDPARTLGKWLEITKPGGLLLASFPGNESFPQWKEKCRDLGLPFTGNTLPDVEEMVVKMSVGPAQVDYYEDTVTQRYSSATDFFRQIKNIGASTQLEGRPLTSRELKILINHWDDSTDGDIEVSYHLVFLAVKRDYDS